MAVKTVCTNTIDPYPPGDGDTQTRNSYKTNSIDYTERWYTLLKRVIKLFPVIASLWLFAGCASIQANKDLNTTPENIMRGDPSNSIRVKEYLQNALASPDGYEVKAYNRKAYSVNTKKTRLIFHSFYVFFKDGKMEHTLVFTATPKGSKQDGNWMFDAATDVDSYNLYVSSDNPWEVEEYQGPHNETILDASQTMQNILERLNKGYTFFGASHVRDLPWYHQLWMFLVPPPIVTYAPLLFMSIHRDSCSSSVLETMAWKQKEE
ncbi:MAG: hypothetical protein LBD78_01470 [Spirochaetaceae bacterium]|jgi:hypothetical protein|nr:hypothetical protein [Spirochaetaceae bacterium]